MKKINTNSNAYLFGKAGVTLGLFVAAGRGATALIKPFVPANVDLATRIGINLITNAVSAAAVTNATRTLDDTVKFFNQTVDDVNTLETDNKN